MMKCKKCGTQNPEGSQYCRNCGCKLIPNEPVDNPTPTNTSNNSTSNNNTSSIWTRLVLFISLVTLISIILININKCSTNDDNYDNHIDFKPEVEQEDSIEYEDSVLADSCAIDSTADYVPDENNYLFLSQTYLRFDADGSTTKYIDVDTNTGFSLTTDMLSWGHVYIDGKTIRVSVDKNTSTDIREDWFEIEGAGKVIRVNVKQDAREVVLPSASIERVWVDHNVYYNGQKGMKIHSEITTEMMKGQRLKVKACFYYEDNITPLKDRNQNSLYIYSYGKILYEYSTFEDFVLFMPHNSLNMSPNVDLDLSFDIVLENSEGTEIDRNENNSFHFSNKR